MLVITRLNSHLYQKELESMFRMRHRVLVEERGWQDISHTDGIERDEFDHEFATYLITLDEEREATGCIRFVPSLTPNLTASVFSHICDLRPLPKSEFVYDGSRLVVDTKYRKKERFSHIASQLVCGWMETAIAVGIGEFTCILDVPYYNLSLNMGWDLQALGTPHKIDGDEVIATLIRCNQEQLDLARRNRKIDDPVLSEQDIDLLRVTHRIIHMALEQQAA